MPKDIVIKGQQIGAHNTQNNYYGITDTELAEQLGVAKAAVKNYLILLEQKHIPINEWDSALRKLAAQQKEMQKLAALLVSKDPEVVSLQEQINHALAKAEYQTAEALLSKVVDLENTAAEKIKAFYLEKKRSAAANQDLKAMSLSGRYAFPEAIEAFQKAVRLSEEGEDEQKIALYRWHLGSAYANNNDYSQALTSYKQSLSYYLKNEGEDSGKATSLRYDIAVTLARGGREGEAVGYYEQALMGNLAHPDMVTQWHNFGSALQSIGEYDKAIKCYNRALKAEDSAGGAAIQLGNLGSVYEEKGEYNSAFEYYEMMLRGTQIAYGQDSPLVAMVWRRLGHVRQVQGENDQAINCYEAALAIDLKNLEWDGDAARDWNNLGSVWRAKGEYDKAIFYYEKALTVNLNNCGEVSSEVVENWTNLGSAWQSKGEYDKAISYYEKALASLLQALSPNDPEVAAVLNSLGVAWEAKGDYEKAKTYYKKVLACNESKVDLEHESSFLIVRKI